MVDSGPGVASAGQLAEGSVIGEYRIVRLLGEGGMGFVYEANHEVLNRRAAIKFLRPELTTNYNVVSRFLQEAKAVNVVSHDNIVDIYDYGERPDGSVYFVMEFLEGEDLSSFLRREEQVALPATCEIFSQILRALSAAHAKQIVHRDLKPDNVFLVPRQDNPRFVKLLDFGIAKLRGEGAVTPQTNVGTVMGTPQYMSPEQAQGKPVDARSDIYSLGVMLYQAATGKLPYEDEMITALLGKIITETPETPRRVALRPAEVSVALEKLIMKAISKHPDARLQTADEMLAHLSAIAAEAGSTAPTPATAAPTRAKRDLTRPLAIGGLLAAAGLAAVVIMAGRGGEAPAENQAAAVAPAVELEGIAGAVAAGNLTEAKTMAREKLAAALASPEDAEPTVLTLAEMRAPHLAPMLYRALDGAPQVRLIAARALRDLGLPESAPKVRAALEKSGGALRIELTALLLDLGDESGVPMLTDALDGKPAEALAAAEALLARGKGKEAERAKAVLGEFASSPPGRARWRRANVALARTGDGDALAALKAELAAPEEDRALATAAALARLGDEGALQFIERVLADPDYPLRGNAAVILARAEKSSALSFVEPALAANDPEHRRAAIAVAAILSKSGKRHLPAISAATDDKDKRTRTSALTALLAF